MPGTPMVGLNDERFGERFFTLANAYDAEYRAVLQTVAAEEGFPLSEGCLFPTLARISKRRQRSA
jgi:xanthosine phosphorylase